MIDLVQFSVQLVIAILGLFQLIVAATFQLVVSLAVASKFVLILTVAQSLILLLFGIFLVMRDIANFLKSLL